MIFDEEAYRDRDPVTEAVKRRQRLVLPADDYELFVDIDDSNSKERFRRAFQLLSLLARKRGDGAWSYVERPSPSGKEGREHIVVRMSAPARDVFHRISLQAILGSDPIREALDWERALEGAPIVTCFFELPEK